MSTYLGSVGGRPSNFQPINFRNSHETAVRICFTAGVVYIVRRTTIHLRCDYHVLLSDHEQYHLQGHSTSIKKGVRR